MINTETYRNAFGRTKFGKLVQFIREKWQKRRSEKVNNIDQNQQKKSIVQLFVQRNFIKIGRPSTDIDSSQHDQNLPSSVAQSQVA